MTERISLALDGPRLEWERRELLRGADAADPAAPPAWELVGAVEWERVSSLRVISAAFGESGLALAISRPAAPATPDQDTVAVARITAAGIAEGGEALVSTEYDPEGVVRRVGIELWPEPGVGRRIAADRRGEAAATRFGELRRDAIPMSFRIDGLRGSGLHELIRPG